MIFLPKMHLLCGFKQQPWGNSTAGEQVPWRETEAGQMEPTSILSFSRPRCPYSPGLVTGCNVGQKPHSPARALVWPHVEGVGDTDPW